MFLFSAGLELGVNTRRRLELIDAIEINMAVGRGLLVLLAIIGSAIGEGFTFNFEEYSDEYGIRGLHHNESLI